MELLLPLVIIVGFFSALLIWISAWLVKLLPKPLSIPITIILHWITLFICGWAFPSSRWNSDYFYAYIRAPSQGLIGLLGVFLILALISGMITYWEVRQKQAKNIPSPQNQHDSGLLWISWFVFSSGLLCMLVLFFVAMGGR